MRIDFQSQLNHHRQNIFLLTLITLGIGLYLLLTTTIASEDAIKFVEYSQDLTNCPGRAITENYQHPGFPALILAAQKIFTLATNNNEPSTWIYSGQITALTFRVLSVIVFYALAYQFLKDKTKAFLATLILIFLPEPAHFGSDCLSDWPHMLFLLSAYCLLSLACQNKKSLFFLLTGLSCGFGYLIRPECIQVILVGGAWLFLQFCYHKRKLTISKILISGLLLIVGFAVVAAPYMHYKDAFFPKKGVGEFSSTTTQEEHIISTDHIIQASAASIDIQAASKLIKNTARTYMYYFLPAAIIGIVVWLRKGKLMDAERFIIFASIILNIAVLYWLHSKYGYISMRHSMPILLIIGIFIPTGIYQIATWLPGADTYTAKQKQKAVLVLTLVGLAICSARLFRPIHWDKDLYLEAANWLEANTENNATVDFADSRIAFYADRARSLDADYVILKIKHNTQEASNTQEALTTITSPDRDYKLVIKRVR